VPNYKVWAHEIFNVFAWNWICQKTVIGQSIIRLAYVQEKEKKIGKKEKEMYTLVNKRRYSSHTFRYGYLVTT
jgi:hypothetical protein